MRVYDPAGHVLDIGEAMDAVVRRMHNQGWSLERIIAVTAMPRAFAEQAIVQASDGPQ